MKFLLVTINQRCRCVRYKRSRASVRDLLLSTRIHFEVHFVCVFSSHPYLSFRLMLLLITKVVGTLTTSSHLVLTSQHRQLFEEGTHNATRQRLELGVLIRRRGHCLYNYHRSQRRRGTRLPFNAAASKFV